MVTRRVAPANYSGFGDVFRSGPPPLGLGVGGLGPVLGPGGPIGPGGHGPGPWGGLGFLPPPGPPLNFNIGNWAMEGCILLQPALILPVDMDSSSRLDSEGICLVSIYGQRH